MPSVGVGGINLLGSGFDADVAHAEARGWGVGGDCGGQLVGLPLRLGETPHRAGIPCGRHDSAVCSNNMPASHANAHSSAVCETNHESRSNKRNATNLFSAVGRRTFQEDVVHESTNQNLAAKAFNHGNQLFGQLFGSSSWIAASLHCNP
jgi:hypothetical protein